MKIINSFLQEERTFEKKDSVKGIVRCPLGKILILRRQNDVAGGGNWDIPGGVIEKGENQIDALKREVYEETGLQISDIKKFKTFVLKIPETGVNSNITIYRCLSKDINVKLKPANWEGSDGKPEHTQYMWLSNKVDLETLPMLGPLKSIILNEFK
jgi:mutator protein MutT